MALLTAAGSAKADYSFPAFDPTTAYPTEQTQLDIVNHVYGSGRIGGGGVDFTYNAVTKNYTNTNGEILVRVQDHPSSGSPGVINLLAGQTTNNDQVWTDGVANITARARYAGYDQHFGFKLGASGGTFTEITNVASGYTDPGTAVNVDFTNQYSAAGMSGTPTWRWAREGPLVPLLSQTSLEGVAENGDTQDHVMTYKYYSDVNNYAPGGIVTEGDDTLGQFAWVVFFEDSVNGVVDADFNDLMVQIDPEGKGNLAPMPASVSMISAGLVGLAGLQLRRRKLKTA